jgi:hypothetical protein
MTMSGGSIALALFGVSNTSSTNSSFPGGPIAYYNYLAKNGASLLKQSNNSPAVASAVAYFQSKIALATPAKATSVVNISANLPSTDTTGATRQINTTVFDSKGNQYTVGITFTNDGDNQWSASATSIKPINPSVTNPVKATVTSGFQVLNFDPVTGNIIPVTTGSNPTTGMSLGVFQLSNGATLAPVFSFSGGGTVGGNLTDNAGAFITTQVQANGNAQVAGPQNITSVNQIFSNPKLLDFILTATGLGDQTQNIGLVKAALLSNPSNKNSVANQLSSTNSKFLSADQTLQLNDGLSTLQNPSTIQALIANYQSNTFEQNIAQNNQSVADARYFAANAAQAVQSASTTTNAVYNLLGDSVMRSVITTALGFPPQLAVLPVQAQASEIASKLNVEQLKNPTFLSQFVTRYLTQVQIAANQDDIGTGDSALALLNGFSNSNSGGSGILV